MNMRLLACLVFSLTACQSNANLPISSPYFKVPVGSRLVLNQPLEIAPTSATVRLQFGKIVSRFDSQDFEPACVFESNIVGESAQRIEPDTFDIIRVRRGNSSLSAHAPPRAGLIAVSTRFIGDGASRQFYKTEFFLRSKKQPQILAMTCQHAREAGATAAELRPLTVAEIQQALGGYFTLSVQGVDI